MKKIILRVILFAGIIFSNPLRADSNSSDYIEISGGEVFIPNRLGNIKLYKDSDGFHVIKNDKVYDIQKCFCDPILRKMSNKQLRTFLGRNKPKIAQLRPEQLNKIKKLIQTNKDNIVEIKGDEKNRILSKLFGGKNGYISVSQMSDGEYRLCTHGRLRGGWGWKLVAFTVGAVVVLAVVGAVVGGVAGALIAGEIGKAACVGAGIGTALGGGTGFVIGVINACYDVESVNNSTSTSEPTPVNNPTSVNNQPQANTAQRQPARDIPPINNPFKENLRSRR